MIAMERLNVVRQVTTEEQAERLLAKGFTRRGGQAEAAVPAIPATAQDKKAAKGKKAGESDGA